MKNLIFIPFLLLILINISNAEIYKWVDEKGVVNYTDDPNKIPIKYLNYIEMLENFKVSEHNLEKDPKNKEEIHKDLLGRGEDYWRNRVGELKMRLMKLQESIEALRLKYNELTERFNESKNYLERSNFKNERDSIKKEMDRIRTEIKEVKIELEQRIPEEARLFKAKEEWIK